MCKEGARVVFVKFVAKYQMLSLVSTLCANRGLRLTPVLV